MTDLGKNLKKILDGTDQETDEDKVRQRMKEYYDRVVESLRKVKGHGWISTDPDLVKEAHTFAYDHGYLGLSNDLHFLLTRTWTWEQAGTGSYLDSQDPHYPHAILEGVHEDKVPWSYIYLVEMLCYRINHSEELNTLSKMHVPCDWYKIADDIRQSVQYWLSKSKLSKELVTRAANVVAGTGYDAGLEDWRHV